LACIPSRPALAVNAARPMSHSSIVSSPKVRVTRRSPWGPSAEPRVWGRRAIESGFVLAVRCPPLSSLRLEGGVGWRAAPPTGTESARAPSGGVELDLSHFERICWDFA
jgi:hypothetical protein